MKQKQATSFDYLLLTILVGLALYLFAPTLQEVALICWSDDDYSHGLLLPFISAFMIWDQRGRLKPTEKQGYSLLLGEFVLLLGLVAFFIGQISGISFASWVAFFPVLLGAIGLVTTPAVINTVAWPILLLFMAKPLPDSVVVRLFWPLQVLAAQVSKAVLEAFRVPVYLMGNVIEIPEMKLLVEEACSGMRSVMALLTLSLIVIYFVRLRWFLKLLLVASSVVVAVILNIFRVAATGLLAHFYSPKIATGFFHTFSGMIVFLVGLPILYYFGILLTKLDQRLGKDKTVEKGC